MTYEALLQKFDPNADALLALISKSTDDEMLRAIAVADYGDKAELHFKALCLIRDEGPVPVPLPWEPGEVLALYRWEEFSETLPPETLIKVHTTRAFACAVLLRSDTDDGSNQTIAILLESLSALEMSFQEAAMRFFAWRVQRLTYGDEESPFYLLALLILILRTQIPLTDTELSDLLNWIYEEVRVVEHYPWNKDIQIMPQWLTWLTIFNQKHEIWQALGQEIAVHADRFSNSEGQQNLKALAHHLEDIKVR